jgi:hydroxymethylglutaryl-CoA synthase
MHGILGWSAYVPHHRLDRSTIAAIAGAGGGKGARAVASYDEDATTMAVEAARGLDLVGRRPASLWFATTNPPYLDKTNATAVHAALRLEPATEAFDVVGSVRSAVGALRAGLGAGGSAVVVASDVRGGLAGSGDETTGGDGAAALLVGDDADGPLLAELVGRGTVTAEFLDRWRAPGAARSKVWEERFGEQRYLELARDAWAAALADGGLTADDVSHVVVAGPHERATGGVAARLGVADRYRDGLRHTIGNTGAAAPLLQLVAALETAAAGEVVALVVLADGADVFLWRLTDAGAATQPLAPLHEQLAAGGPVSYAKYLAWRGVLGVEPPRRPEPARPSASAAGRATSWKFGFVGSEGVEGTVHLPPSPLDAEERPMADAVGTIRTFTIDRLSYSPSPPIVFAVVDFDGGGRLPIELTDVDADEIAIGQRVEMTFRVLFTADGIHNYFWKARPVRTAAGRGA